MMRKS